MLNGLDIIYQDDDLIAIDKPSYLLSVPGRGEDKQDSVASRVIELYKSAKVVHRLDWATSGLMIMALNKEAHRQLNWQFERRQVSKRYIAIVYGKIPFSKGIINLPLICDWENRPKQRVDYEVGKEAITYFEVDENYQHDSRSRVILTPQTGRSHQLRLHLQSMGFAIVGDRLYAEKAHNPSDEMRMFLHAETLQIKHPSSGEVLKLTSPCSF